MSGSSPIKISKSSFARRVFTLLVLAGVLTSSLPIPLGWKVISRTASEPFPCQACNCGCTTPEQCWTACCCFTPQQRRQWAEKQGIIPPAYAVLDRPVTKTISTIVSTHPTSESSTCCHCSPDKQPAICNTAVASTSTAQTASRSASSTCDSSLADAQPQLQDGQTVLVLSLQAARCRGASTAFTWLPWAIIDSPAENLAPPQAVVLPYRLVDITLCSVILDIESPPPRHSS